MRALKVFSAGLAASAAVLFAAPVTYAQETLHGRVSFADNDGLVKGANDADWSYATLNSLVLAGDTVWADNDGVLELEFSGGTFVRLADGSKLEVVSVSPNAVFRAWNGSFYVQRVKRSSGPVTLQTAVGAVSIDPDSQARIDILTEGQTTVTVRWGRAVISPASGDPVVVSQGYQSYIDPGYLPSTPREFDRSYEDEFDAWNRERARLLAVGTEAVPIIDNNNYEQAPVGVSDLNSYGEWVYVDDDYYWRPTVVHEYVPYRAGHWGYAYDDGYYWVDDYPFGYVTSHYGYWDYRPRYGWLWRYHGHYRPAYCATLRYGDYFVWSPLNYYGHPVHYGYDNFYAGGVYFGIGACSYALAVDVLGGHYYGYGHGYSHGLTPHFYNNNFHDNNVFIWNINLNGGRYHDTTYRGSTLPVRDYSPQRVMRGPSSLGSSARSATSRVAALESTARREFSPTSVASARGASERGISSRGNNAAGGATARSQTQTVRSGSERNAALRTASVRTTAHTEVTNALQRAERTSNATRSMMTGRRSTTETFTNADVRGGQPISQIVTRTRSSDSARSVDRGETASRGAAGDGSTIGSDVTSRTATRGAAIPGDSTRNVIDDASRVTSTRLNAIEPTARDDFRVQPEAATTREAATSERGGSTVNRDFSGEQPRPTTTRAAVPEGTFESAVPRDIGSARSSRVAEPSSRATSSTRAESPSASREPSVTRESSPSYRSAPSSRSVDRSPSSNVTRVAPPSRSDNSSRYTAPSSRGSYSAPSATFSDRGSSSQRMSSPSSRNTFSMPAPSSSRFSSPAPSRSYSAPSSAPSSRSFSAPSSRSSSPAPSRSFSSPSTSSRSFSAPSQSSSRFGGSSMSSRGSSFSGRSSGISSGGGSSRSFGGGMSGRSMSSRGR